VPRGARFAAPRGRAAGCRRPRVGGCRGRARRGEEGGRAQGREGEEEEEGDRGEGRGGELTSEIKLRRSPSPKPRAPWGEREVAARENSNERKGPGGARMESRGR
jgi:hypothetical protein